MVMPPRIGPAGVGWPSPDGSDRTLGLVGFSIFPHLKHAEMPQNTLAHAEQGAATIPGPSYAVDDQTAIQVVGGVPEVISEGGWRRLRG